MATTGHRASSPSWPLGGEPGPWLLTLAPGAIAMPWGITSRHPGLAWEAGRLQRAQPIGSICAKTLAEQKGKQPSRGGRRSERVLGGVLVPFICLFLWDLGSLTRNQTLGSESKVTSDKSSELEASVFTASTSLPSLLCPFPQAPAPPPTHPPPRSFIHPPTNQLNMFFSPIHLPAPPSTCPWPHPATHSSICPPPLTRHTPTSSTGFLQGHTSSCPSSIHSPSPRLPPTRSPPTHTPAPPLPTHLPYCPLTPTLLKLVSTHIHACSDFRSPSHLSTTSQSLIHQVIRTSHSVLVS